MAKPRILKVTWADLLGPHELGGALEQLRTTLVTWQAQPDLFPLPTLIALLWGPWGPPLGTGEVPPTVGHVLYRLTDQLAARGEDAFTLLDVFRDGDWAQALSVWRWDWRMAYENERGESTIPEVLGTAPELPWQ